MRVAQVDVAIKFEDKLTNTIFFLIDIIEWPTFYEELSKIVNILNELRNSEVVIRQILDRWIKREQEVVAMCIEVIDLPVTSRIENIFDQ